ncbi:MAG: pilus assembly protein PilZ [Treponema sp.]|nr:pilus assembly protein PilZ [Treponema sp.]
MAILTKQKIANYYELFKSIDVSFSKEIIQITGLVTNQVHLKCVGDFWPCVIHSSSFQGAKVIVNIKSGILRKLEQANNTVSLRFCFKTEEKGNPVTFFVNTRSSGYSPYGGSPDVAVFTLQYTQRPPDDLIEIMGRILDANINSKKRKDERILVSPDSIRKMSLIKESAILIQGVPRHCILRELSFMGVKVIIMGVAKFLADKEAIVKLDFDDPRESFTIKGRFVNAETIEGRKELVSLEFHFDESLVPMGYKVRVNDYLSIARPEGKSST